MVWVRAFPGAPSAMDRGHPALVLGFRAGEGSCSPRSPKARDRGHPASVRGVQELSDNLCSDFRPILARLLPRHLQWSLCIMGGLLALAASNL